MGVPNPPAVRRLGERDREVLWLVSQGCTYFQVGRKLGISEKGAQSAARRAMYKLGTTNIVRAVTLALLNGEIGRWRGCGTHAAYQRHRKLHQTADPACLIAKAEYDRGYRAAEWLGVARPPAPAGPGQEYRRIKAGAFTGKVVRIEAVDADGITADVTDVGSGKASRIRTLSLHPGKWTKYGTERRYGYVRIKETAS